MYLKAVAHALVFVLVLALVPSADSENHQTEAAGVYVLMV
jgi:hypothetical protein